ERNRIRADAAAGLKIPEWLSCFRIQSVEIPFVRAAEHEAARRGEHAGPRRRMQPEFPDHLAGDRIERANSAPGVIRRQFLLSAAREERSGFIVGLALVIGRAGFA